jgi:tetrahydromethanopterin S-methyltransferase subunit C
MKGNAATSIASVFALAAFAVAIVAGLASGNPTSSILLRAIIAMLACYPVGLVVGHITQRVIQDHVEAHRQANPAPEPTDDGSTEPEPDQDEEIIVV